MDIIDNYKGKFELSEEQINYCKNYCPIYKLIKGNRG